MKRVLNPFPILAVLGLLFFCASFSVAAYADTHQTTSSSRPHRYSRGLPRPEVPGLGHSLGVIAIPILLRRASEVLCPLRS